MRQLRPALIGRGWLWASAAGVAVLLLASTGQAQQGAGGGAAAGASVDRGKYLVSITGCHDCHSPKTQGMTPDPARLLSGRPSTTKMPSKADGEIHASLDFTAFYGPWGQTVASNLTPDKATGLPARGYNEKTFIQAMRTGKKPNGTAMQPPMPVEVYQNLSDDDLRSIWMFLQTLKPVNNAYLAGLETPGAKK